MRVRRAGFSLPYARCQEKKKKKRCRHTYGATWRRIYFRVDFCIIRPSFRAQASSARPHEWVRGSSGYYHYRNSALTTHISHRHSRNYQL